MSKILPLYQFKHPDKRPSGAHAGLWFERFFNRYDEDYQLDKNNDKETKTDKQRWIESVGKHCGNADTLKQAALQQLRLIDSLAGSALVFETDYHFVTGLGSSHPIENGFLWHPTLAVPYLSGSSVKGMLRHWLEHWQEQDKESLRKNFGSTSKDPENNEQQVGECIFFDALPIEPVELGMDIMTPHYSPWYQNGHDKPKENPPADWYEPVPIPFLVVKKAKFLFTLASRNSEKQEEISKMAEYLTEALSYLGAGAKTALGYGQMTEDSTMLDALKKSMAD